MNNLNKDLLYALFKFRKAAVHFSIDQDIRLNEVIAMIIVDSQYVKNEKSLLAAELGETLCVTHSAVSQILASLEKKGYVRRTISESDKRQYRFTLTDKGKQVTYEMKKKMDTTIEKIISSFGENKIIALTQMLNEFADHWEQLQDESE